MKHLFVLFLTTVMVSFFCMVLSGCSNRRLEMRINYTMNGCFGSEVSELTTYKTEHLSTAILKTKGQTTKEVNLSDGQIPALAAFVYEFRQLPESNCFSTTEADYVITYFDGNDYITIKKQCGCLNWDGFARLKNILFNYRP